MDVILSQSQRLPIVAVNIWYHVGPANEEPGRTGFAHLFEHMMFQGSKHVPADGHFQLLEGAGASECNSNFESAYRDAVEAVEVNATIEMACCEDQAGVFDEFCRAGF